MTTSISKSDLDYMSSSIFLANMDLIYWSVRSFCKRGGYGVKGGEWGNCFSQLQVLVNENLLNLYDPPVKLFIGPG